MFLGVLDQTIVATAFPSIVAHFQGAITTAELEAGGTFSPLYGKLCLVRFFFGDACRRHSLPTLWQNYFSTQLGSALCGAAQNMAWLIPCRALQGIGGGGLRQLSMVTISHIVTSNEYISIQAGGDMVAYLALPIILRAWLDHSLVV
ncbi:hypothetical protein OG21DRAFT_413516 [Imleria badia]|nr:hypothetical protein OG21DRAFT_413516 [Imleria badia]